jgi:hypothetical protein
MSVEHRRQFWVSLDQVLSAHQLVRYFETKPLSCAEGIDRNRNKSGRDLQLQRKTCEHNATSAQALLFYYVSTAPVTFRWKMTAVS